MSVHQISDKFLSGRFDFYRSTGVKDDVGDLNLTETKIYASVKGNLQPQTADTEFELQGRVHHQTHELFINQYDPAKRTIQSGDIVLDSIDNHKYIVLGVNIQMSRFTNKAERGYIKLNLKHISDARYE